MPRLLSFPYVFHELILDFAVGKNYESNQGKKMHNKDFTWGFARSVWFSIPLFLLFNSSIVVAKQETPDALKNIQVAEHLGSSVDIKSYNFKDEAGHSIPFESFFNQKKPVVLNLGYFHCGTLCNYSYQGISKVLSDTKDLKLGSDYEVVSISFDPKDDASSASEKRNQYGWRFLTGSPEQVKRLADQLGFPYNYIPAEKQFAHPAVSFVLTPSGKISRYLYGIEFQPKDFKLALLEASNGKIGTLIDRILMFCYHYDPSSRKYSLYSFRLIQAGSASTVAVFGGYLMVFWTRQRKSKVGSTHV
jgi:protein SCO1/2